MIHSHGAKAQSGFRIAIAALAGVLGAMLAPAAFYLLLLLAGGHCGMGDSFPGALAYWLFMLPWEALVNLFGVDPNTSWLPALTLYALYGAAAAIMTWLWLCGSDRRSSGPS